MIKMFHSEKGAVFLLINHSLIPAFVDAKLMLIKNVLTCINWLIVLTGFGFYSIVKW